MSATTPRRGLGRGLGALIPASGSSDEAQAPEVGDAAIGAVYAELPIDRVVPNPRQPRSAFDEDALAELVFSIREIGLLQPVVVRRVGIDQYELVAGERRLRACREAGLAVIPAIIRDTDDDAMLRDALLENLHRADLNPLEEAAAYQQLLSDFGCTQDELARRIGRSRPQVSNTLRLLRLPPDVQRRVAAGVLSAGHARALLSLDDTAAMEALATRIVAEGLSVRSVEEIIIVGDADGRKRKSSPRSRVTLPRDPQLADAVRHLGGRVGDALDTRVSVDGFAGTSSRGRLLIECADLDDLRRIVDVIAGA
jgi:ParB family transcriptional regulator, chromosome partitioning protein